MELKKFVKKPVVVEGILITKENINEVYHWLEDEFKDRTVRLIPNLYDGQVISVKSSRSNESLNFSIGDYAIKGVDGTVYPCKGSTFPKIYEETVPGAIYW